MLHRVILGLSLLGFAAGQAQSSEEIHLRAGDDTIDNLITICAQCHFDTHGTQND